ncbi:MAG: hypothetical protein JJU33_05955 [Phycisphaerales bacterium]|nr:hypothetical protein [Phycisphaerales bacterium]
MNPNQTIPLAFQLPAAVGVIVVMVLVVFGMYILVMSVRAMGGLVKGLIRFLGREVRDLAIATGALIACTIAGLMALLSMLRGNPRATRHFALAAGEDARSFGLAMYRVVLGNLLRACRMTPIIDAIERRLPGLIRSAPRAAQLHASPAKAKSTQKFEGYRIVGTLKSGGSGSKLYVAAPDEKRQEAFEKAGHHGVTKVVLKCFSLGDGSSLPQIVRESRSLDAAKRLGLVLDHELSADRFMYVMRFVPGDSLAVVTERLHRRSGPEGLDDASLQTMLGYTADLLRTLATYHDGGLWHKDVKPDNIIVDEKRAHLVDLGLVTPLRSAMTLTTHGTEYFRDPELVRLALRGVKVSEVDGSRFDVYAAGAVLYSTIENSFPAHGGLSQVSKRCPEALRWIVRRAMTEYDKRYTSAEAMLADLSVLQKVADPFKVRPAALPSMGGAAPELDELLSGPATDLPGRRSAAEQLAAARQRAKRTRHRALGRRSRTGLHRGRRGLPIAATGVGAVVIAGVVVVLFTGSPSETGGSSSSVASASTPGSEQESGQPASFQLPFIDLPLDEPEQLGPFVSGEVPLASRFRQFGAPELSTLAASLSAAGPGRIAPALATAQLLEPLITAELFSGSYLVVSDLRRPHSERDRAFLVSLAERMSGRGFTVMHDIEAGAADDTVRRMLARAITARAGRSLDHASTHADLGEWLTGSNQLQGVLWVEQGDEGGHKVHLIQTIEPEAMVPAILHRERRIAIERLVGVEPAPGRE